MARQKGLSPFSGNFEPQYAGPFDARDVVGLKTDLTNSETWLAKDGSSYIFTGMTTTVSTDTEENNGIYRFKGGDATDINNWVKEGSSGSGGAVDSVNGQIGVVVLDKEDIGLGNVDNTSDLEKPISTAVQTELDTKQDELVSGTNIKTVNNQSILGFGNITLASGGISNFSQNFTADDVVNEVLTINHALDSQDIIVVIYDNENKQYIPSDIEIIDNNTIEIIISAAIEGTYKVVINSGSSSAGGENYTAGIGINIDNGVISSSEISSIIHSQSEYTKGYIATNGEIGTVVNVNNITSHATIYCYVTKVNKGDEVEIVGYGGISPRLWCVTDNEYKIIASSEQEANHPADNPAMLKITSDGYVIAQNNTQHITEGQTKITTSALNEKQNILTSGSNIKIENDVISGTKDLVFTRVVSSADFTSGYIKTDLPTGEYIDTSNVIENATYSNYVLPVTKGQTLRFSGSGGGVPRLWCLLDSDSKVIDKSAPSLNIANNPQTILVEEDGYFVIQSNLVNYSYYSWVEVCDSVNLLSTVEDVVGGQNSSKKLSVNLFNSLMDKGKGFNLIPDLRTVPFGNVVGKATLNGNVYTAENVTSAGYFELINEDGIVKFGQSADSWVYYIAIDVLEMPTNNNSVKFTLQCVNASTGNPVSHYYITSTGKHYFKLVLNEQLTSTNAFRFGITGGVVLDKLVLTVDAIGIVPEFMWDDSLYTSLQFGDVAANAAYAIKAKTSEYTENVILPSNSFTATEVLFDVVENKAYSPGMFIYDSNGGVNNLVKERVDGVLKYAGNITVPGNSFANLGMSFSESLRGNGEKYAIIIKGTYTGRNAGIVVLSSNNAVIIPGGIEDDKVYNIEKVYEFEFDENLPSNLQHPFLKSLFYDADDNYFEYNLTDYFAAKYVEGWKADDYIRSRRENFVSPTTNTNTALTEQKLFQITAKEAPTFEYDVNMLICYGQSLSVGTGAANSYTDFNNLLCFQGGCNEWMSRLEITDEEQVAAYYGDSFRTVQGLNTGFAPAIPMALTWMQTINRENNIDLKEYGVDFITSTPGEGGVTIEQLSKNPPGGNLFYYYGRLLKSVEEAKRIANLDNKTFGVPVLYWVQGEANQHDDEQTYYDKFVALMAELNTDIKAITGQTDDVQIITYQRDSVIGVINTATGTPYTDSGPTFALLKASQDVANIHMGGPLYQFYFGDIWHPYDRTIIGLQSGIVAKRIINDKKPMPAFHPKSHKVIDMNGKYVIQVTYDVPVLPMRFDISGDQWHNKNGEQPNYGFTLVNTSGENIIASKPTITRGNVLTIECTENPTGASLNYALNGHYGGGNLCDSQNIAFESAGETYIIDNFAVAFRNYVI